MTTILGIDTGGTYTDGVILERETKQIITSAKSLTTHENLIEGIRGVIQKLEYDKLSEIDYVALSTTLATNAIVENHGCRVGLLLLGHTPEHDLPPCQLELIPGSIDLAGHEREPLSEEAVLAAVKNFEGKVDAVAVSGIFSVRNPSHEDRAAAIVREHLSVPVIMAHELTGTLGVEERTNTAVLNGKLISVIAELMQAVKEAMKERGIEAPLMIVKGDGSLMNEKIALERPIETILSGPAASIIGATYLNDVTDGLIVDMGGTTTDVAVLSNGKPLLTKEGANVGGWRTRVSAVNAYTFGLGGDSYISRNYETGKWSVGPQRSRPISMVSLEYPYYKEELLRRHGRFVGMARFGQADGLILLHQPDKTMDLTEVQKKLIDALADGPHTVVTLGKMIDVNPSFFYIDRLVSYGILGLVGFTPSDVLCAKGLYTTGDAEAAQAAALLMAAPYGYSEGEFYDMCLGLVDEKMCRCLWTCILERGGHKMAAEEKLAEYYFQQAIGRESNDMLDVSFHINMPVVGIGAPIHAWLPQAGRKFGVEPLISYRHEVANAIGAAAGEVMTIYSLLVQNHYGEYLTIFAPWGKSEIHPPEVEDIEAPPSFEALIETAVETAIEDGKAHLRDNMTEQGIPEYQILVEREDARVTDTYSDNLKLFIESRIDVIAVGLPAWAD